MGEEMIGFPIELQIWSCERKVNEYVLKIDHYKKRAMEYSEGGFPKSLVSSEFERANYVLYAGIQGEIERYTGLMHQAIDYGLTLRHICGCRDNNWLHGQILTHAFYICGCQRLLKYAMLLGWSREYTREVASYLTAHMHINSVLFENGSIEVIHGHGFLSSQVRIIAIHGGMACNLDYQEVYKSIKIEKIP